MQIDEKFRAAVRRITFRSVPQALETCAGQGGWFFWEYATGECHWYPMWQDSDGRWTTRDDILIEMAGRNGLCATWSTIRDRVVAMV